MGAQLLRMVFVGALATYLLAGQQPGGSDAVLAQGDPPLTRNMVDHRLAVWESFLEARFTQADREALAKTIIDGWNHGDAEEIKHTLSDVKLYGQEAELKAARDTNQAQFVQNLRNDSRNPQDAILLRAFEAAHPHDRDVMHARGLDDLVGKWEQGDAMTAPRNPVTHRTEGISFTDALVLNIYSDGRFRHLWSHSHCSNGTCCRQYGTAANGTIDVNGSTLVLANETGQIIARDPCFPAGNTGKALEPVRETFHWSLQKDPATDARKLCLSGRPFQFTKEDATKPVCYVKQP